MLLLIFALSNHFDAGLSEAMSVIWGRLEALVLDFCDAAVVVVAVEEEDSAVSVNDMGESEEEDDNDDDAAVAAADTAALLLFCSFLRSSASMTSV